MERKKNVPCANHWFPNVFFFLSFLLNKKDVELHGNEKCARDQTMMSPLLLLFPFSTNQQPLEQNLYHKPVISPLDQNDNSCSPQSGLQPTCMYHTHRPHGGVLQIYKRLFYLRQSQHLQSLKSVWFWRLFEVASRLEPSTCLHLGYIRSTCNIVRDCAVPLESSLVKWKKQKPFL